MGQPIAYNRLKDFTQYALDHTSAPYNASDHDAELDAIEQTLDGLCANIELIQRNDGKLRNQSVHPDSLSTATKALIGAGRGNSGGAAWTPRGLWVTATEYEVGDVVEQGGRSYVCATDHTSGTFNTDHTAGKWVIIDSTDGSVSYFGVATGTGDAMVVELPVTGLSDGFEFRTRAPGANTVTNPTVTVGGSTVTITKHGGGALTAGDYAAGSELTLRYRESASHFEMVAYKAASLAELAASGGSALIGHAASGSGATASDVQTKLRELKSPYDYGAEGDGTNADQAAFTAADAVTTHILIPNGTFKISANTSIDAVLVMAGGQITVDSGVTLTIGGVIGELSTVYFKGAGTVKTKNRIYSLGWFEGSTANAKWDFLRRAFTTNQKKVVYFPQPRSDDAAETAGLFGPAWKVTAPLEFDDPENELIVYSDAVFAADATFSGTGMFKFSPTNKTEAIYFPNGLLLDGMENADRGIDILGGARIKFGGHVRCQQFNDACVRWYANTQSLDECEFDFLEVVGFGAVGVDIIGTTSHSVVSSKINYLFTNGGATGCTNLVRIRGNTRFVEIGRIFENVTSPYVDWSGKTVSIEAITANSATAGGSSRYGTRIGDIYQFASAQQPVECIDSSSGAQTKHQVDIGRIVAPSVSGVLVSLLWNNTSTYQGAADDISRTTEVQIASACSDIDISGRVAPAKIAPNTGTALSTRLRNGGTHKFQISLADDSATFLRVSTQQDGLLTVVCTGDSNAVVVATVRAGAICTSLLTGSSATLSSSTALAGTTGTDAKMNVSANGGNIYIENRLAATRTFAVTFVSA